jgi:hypothetical protein
MKSESELESESESRWESKPGSESKSQSELESETKPKSKPKPEGELRTDCKVFSALHSLLVSIFRCHTSRTEKKNKGKIISF